ncbi:MAG: head GIN domain-containing protein [Bacteroidia bacterium]|nr:head GIN domain-containing protein [Bacteroidia bacterium]
MRRKEVFLYGILIVIALGFYMKSKRDKVHHARHEDRPEAFQGEDRTEQLGSFSLIEASGDVQIVLAEGDAAELQLKAGEGDHRRLRYEIRGERLVLWTEGWDHGGAPPVVYLNCQPGMLQGIEASGAVRVDGDYVLKGDEVKLRASGASSFDVDVDARQLDVEADGASQVDLSGKADAAVFRLSGASRLDADSMESSDIAVEASGAAQAEIDATGKLRVEASGASRVHSDSTPKEAETRVSGAASYSADED